MHTTATAQYLNTSLTVNRRHEWNFVTPVAHEGISQYFPIWHFCLWLSIDWRTQIALLKENSRFDHALQGIRYETVAG